LNSTLLNSTLLKGKLLKGELLKDALRLREDDDANIFVNPFSDTF